MDNALHPNALEANRKGRLTLLQALGLMPWVLLSVVPVVLGVDALLWFFSTLSSGRFAEYMAIRVVLLGGALLGGAALLLIAYLMGGKLLLDILIGPVAQQQGVGMKFSGSSASKSHNYYYSVGGMDFQVQTIGTYNKLHDANVACAYYLPRRKWLVNIEWGLPPVPASRRTGDVELDQILRLEEAEKGK